MITLQELVNLINALNIKLDKFSIKDLMTGYNIELEHSSINSDTNVTNNNKLMTLKIALAHLNEYPDYYNEEYGLPKLEQFNKWHKRNWFANDQFLFLLCLFILILLFV